MLQQARVELPNGTSDGATWDEVAEGNGRSHVSLGVLGEKEMRSAFVHVYLQASAGSPEKQLLSYSAIFADRDALSLMTGPNGPAIDYEWDRAYSSEFCSQSR